MVGRVARRRALAGIGMPAAAVPAGWMHAMIMQYQVLPSFIFGFLLTVFPRWISLPALTPRALRAGGRRHVRRTAAHAGGAVPAACRCCKPARCSRSPAG